MRVRALAVLAGVVMVVVLGAVTLEDDNATVDAVAPEDPPSTFPDATTTGVPADVTLASSGPLVLENDGITLDRLEIHGEIVVRADDVTIRRSRILADRALGVRIDSGSVVVEDTEIIGIDESCQAGIGYSNYTARRVNVHGCRDGLKVGANTTVVDSYIHDLRKETGSHNDGMQSTGGSNSVIRGNTVLGPHRQSVSALKFTTEKGAIDRLVVENNYLYGGNYTIYLDEKGFGPTTNAIVRNNVIEKGSFKHGWRTYDGHSTQSWTGNRWHTGELIGD